MKKSLSLSILHYFRLLAKAQILKIRLLQNLRRKKLTIVGITSSAGKSSTLNVCEAALKDSFNIKTNQGSNSESGIPLSILSIKVTGYSPMDWLKYILLAPVMLIANWNSYDILLLEMGIDGPDEPKNMSYLLKIVRPSIGIFLNVNLVHSLQFDKTVSQDIKGQQRETQILQNIGREKARLIMALPPRGYAILNINDPIVSQTTQTVLAKKIFLKPVHLNFDRYAPPASFDLSVSAALELAKIFNLPITETKFAIQRNLTLPPSRSSLFKGINNSTIIDSSYNSSPLAASEMLEVLKRYSSPRITILGDMRELGLQSPSAHQAIYRQAQKCADQIISVGPETQKYFGDRAIKFEFWWQALDYLKKNLPKNATILIKGSQNTIFLEEIVKALLADPGDIKHICRQSPYWQNLKHKFQTTSRNS